MRLSLTLCAHVSVFMLAKMHMYCISIPVHKCMHENACVMCLPTKELLNSSISLSTETDSSTVFIVHWIRDKNLFAVH